MSGGIETDARRPDTSSDRRHWGSRSHLVVLSTVAIALVAVAAGELAILNHASNHAFRGNSDGATVVLEGQWMSAGHLALSGWDLSLDSFWSLDALFYTAAIRLVGVHGELLTLVPSVIALGVIAIGVCFALRERRTRQGQIAAVAIVVAILGVPANNLAYFFLQGPWHVATVLACLGAFWALARERFGWNVAVAAVLLAAGLLGDTQTALLGLAPALGAAGAAVLRRRSWRAGAPGVVAVVASIGVAFAVRFVARAFGTFSIATGYPRAHAKQIPQNLEHLGSWGISLLGHGALPTIAMDNGSGRIDLIRLIEIGLVVVGIAVGLAGLALGIVRGPQTSPADAVGWRLDDLLVFGIVGDCILFVAVTPNDNGNYARYLTASVLYGTILAARVVGRSIDRLPVRFGTAGTVLAAGVFAVAAVAFPRDLHIPAASQPDSALATFLEAHHLHNGVGDYWSASLTTVESADRVHVRPVITDPAHQLVRYGRQSAANWYQGVNFNFVVFDLARPWRKVNATSATATFGKPSQTLAEGSYRILVWDKPFHVSTVGFSNK